MTEKINPETKFIIKIYTFEYYVKFSFWVSVDVLLPVFDHNLIKLVIAQG